MSDIIATNQEYHFDKDIDEEKLRDIAASAGVTFENKISPDHLSSGFHDGNVYWTLNNKSLPHHSVYFEGSENPGYKIRGYNGDIDYTGQVEHIIENGSVELYVETRVPNRQGGFSEHLHDRTVEDGRKSLEESVERHLDEQGEWD